MYLLFKFYIQLIGDYREASSSTGGGLQWRDGILTRLIRQTQNLDNVKMLQNHPDAQSSLTIEVNTYTQ